MSKSLLPRAVGEYRHFNPSFRAGALARVRVIHEPRFNQAIIWNNRAVVVETRIRHWMRGCPWTGDYYGRHRSPIELVRRKLEPNYRRQHIAGERTSFDYFVLDADGQRTWIGEENLVSCWPKPHEVAQLWIRFLIERLRKRRGKG